MHDLEAKRLEVERKKVEIAHNSLELERIELELHAKSIEIAGAQLELIGRISGANLSVEQRAEIAALLAPRIQRITSGPSQLVTAEMAG